jgi:ACS family hexuronate transporter-like MFS transporter
MSQGLSGAPDAAAALDAGATTGSRRHVRWLVAGLLFALATMYCIDRQSIGVLSPILRRELRWDARTLGWINFAHPLAMVLSVPLVGRFVDRIGVKAALIWGVVVASVATMGHALAAGVVAFAALRFLLGVGEAAWTPASIKAIAEWFPIRQRAFAVAIASLGTNAGVMLLPLTVLVATTAGWRTSFAVGGFAGLACVAAWAALYRSSKSHPDPGDAQVPWLSVLGYRQFWGYALGRMFSGTATSLFLYVPQLAMWRGASALQASVMLAPSALAMVLGSLIGGFLSGYLMKRGRSIASARLTVMTAAAMGAPILAVGAVTHDAGTIVCIVALASMCHGLWEPNMAMLPADIFPTNVLGTVVGLGTVGALLGSPVVGGLGFALRANAEVTSAAVFVVAGLLHPLALLAMVSVAGRDLRPVPLEALIPAR